MPKTLFVCQGDSLRRRVQKYNKFSLWQTFLKKFPKTFFSEIINHTISVVSTVKKLESKDLSAKK